MGIGEVGRLGSLGDVTAVEVSSGPPASSSLLLMEDDFVLLAENSDRIALES